jgi:hypothetical protein
VYAVNPSGNDFWAFNPATNMVHHYATQAGTVTTSLLAFGNSLVTVPTATRTVTVRNMSSASLTVTGATISAGYSITSNNCGILAAYASCTIEARFTPTAAGPAAGTLDVTYSDGGSSTVALTGTGVNSVLAVSPSSLDFGGISMGTFSSPQWILVRNNLSTPVTITGVTASAGYVVSNDCGTLVADGSCNVSVIFSPQAAGAVVGSVFITTSMGFPSGITLTGVGERSLVTHYYRSILGRTPDTSGHAFWESEVARVTAFGGDMSEVWFTMAGFFFNSVEYTNAFKSNSQFVTDLYNTFFNRGPDATGLNYWTGLIQQGMPREVVLYSFMFSPEFRSFTTALFGDTSARPEVNIVMDFYRGIMNRLPDNDGFAFYLGRMRGAQCSGAAAVRSLANEMSTGFLNSSEYFGRSRSNSQYVTDLYYSFLRRGGDLGGVTFWINELNAGRRTREQLRADFMQSAEFNGRVDAVIAAGCVQ